MSNEPKASPEMYLKYCNIFFISSIVTMWVLLDDLRPVEVDIDQRNYASQFLWEV